MDGAVAVVQHFVSHLECEYCTSMSAISNVQFTIPQLVYLFLDGNVSEPVGIEIVLQPLKLFLVVEWFDAVKSFGKFMKGFRALT